MNYATIMDRVDAMPQEHAVDFLLSVIADIMPSALEERHKVDEWNLHLSPTERVILCALVDASPNLVCHNQIEGAMLWRGDPDRTFSKKMIHVYIAKIRQKMGKSRGKIENMWGRGYRYIRPVDGAMLS